MRNRTTLWLPVWIVAFLFVPSVRADAPADPVKGLEAWLAKTIAERGKISDQPFSSVALTKEAQKARKLLWDDHVKTIRAERWNAWKT